VEHGHSPEPSTGIRLWGRERTDVHIDLTAQEVWELASSDVFAPVIDARVECRLRSFVEDLGSGDLARMRRAMLRLGDHPDAKAVAALLASWARYLPARLNEDAA
jgi:hypothetical protein